MLPEGAPAPAGEVLPNDPDNPAPPAGLPVEGPLRALPVEPLDAGGEEVESPRPIRAIPVSDDEVIEEGVEEP